MQTPRATPEVQEELLDQLRAYTALDNPIRLRAYMLIHDSPGISFHEIANAVGVESGLLAYHVGVLKAADVIDVDYRREGREITAYRLTQRGDEIYGAMFRKEGSRPKVMRAPGSRTIPAR